jgi:hypothetical protein
LGDLFVHGCVRAGARFLDILQKLAGADIPGMRVKRPLPCAVSHGLQLVIGGTESGFNIFRTGDNSKLALQIEK